MTRSIPQAVITLTASSFISKYRGAYSSSVTYKPGEWVSENGILWSCQAEVKGVTPAVGTGAWDEIGSIE